MVSEFSNIFYYINLKGPPTPPRVNQRLPRITATAGKVFRFVIPVDTFIDTEGNTRKLELELLSSDGKNLGDVLWIGFDAEKQVRNFFSLVILLRNLLLFISLSFRKCMDFRLQKTSENGISP